MHVLVIYDIVDDGVRGKVADCCLDYGLDRVQYSAFVGELSRTYQEELLLRIKRRVGKRAAKVQLVAIGAEEWSRRIVFEQAGPAEGKTADVAANGEPRSDQACEGKTGCAAVTPAPRRGGSAARSR